MSQTNLCSDLKQSAYSTGKESHHQGGDVGGRGDERREKVGTRTHREGGGRGRKGERIFLFQRVQQNPVSRSGPEASPRPPSAAAVLPD